MDWVEAVRARILTALAKAYLNEYAGYKLWADAVPVLIREDETEAGNAAKRMANNRSHRLDGFKAAAEALGIGADELLQAVAEQGAKEEGGESE